MFFVFVFYSFYYSDIQYVLTIVLIFLRDCVKEWKNLDVSLSYSSLVFILFCNLKRNSDTTHSYRKSNTANHTYRAYFDITYIKILKTENAFERISIIIQSCITPIFFFYKTTLMLVRFAFMVAIFRLLYWICYLLFFTFLLLILLFFMKSFILLSVLRSFNQFISALFPKNGQIFYFWLPLTWN